MDMCGIYWGRLVYLLQGGYVDVLGMPNALFCAEAVGMMILGREPPEYFPRSYLLTSGRMEKALADAGRSERGEAVKRIKL